MSDDLRHDRHDERLNRLEEQLLDLSDNISEISRMAASQDATLHIMANQLGTLTNQPSKIPVIVSAAGVAITFMALALTPIAWLAVNNAAQLDRQAIVISESAAQIDALHNEINHIIDRTESDFDDIETRILQLEQMRMSGQ